MSNWWEIQQAGGGEPPLGVRAIAYYRHSAQDRQENSIPIQQDQVREWAAKNGVHIIHEFSDAGKSGLNAEGRPAFTEMMEEWVKKRADFDYVLCLDVSRWGRFQDIDLSAQFSAECRRHRKQIIYTTIGKPREDDPLYPVYVQFERFRAAQYSRELSDKVWRGCCKIAEQGYWAGGPPPYATQRLLLDEKREPLHTLEAGQRKGIQNQRVTLVGGDASEVAVIKRIFHEFIHDGFSEYLIASVLGQSGDIFFPKLDEERDMIAFDRIAVDLLEALGMEAEICSSEEEAREQMTRLLSRSGRDQTSGPIRWPVYFFASDTSGEKAYEEFFTAGEKLDLDRFINLGVVKDSPRRSLAEIDAIFRELQQLFDRPQVSKADIVDVFKGYLPNFDHIEKGKGLDQKM